MGTAAKEQTRPLYEGQKVSREEYLDLPDDGFKYDMINGVLQLSPSHDFDHGEVQTRIIRRMGDAVDKGRQGRLATEVDVLLPDGGDVVRPDVSFVLHKNAHRILKTIHGAPDIAVEILSDSTRDRDLDEKADRYLKSGVQEYWILDPRDKKIHVWNNRGDKWDKREGGSLKSELLEGFEVKAGEVFG